MLKNKDKNTILLEKQVEALFKSTVSGGLANIFSACLIYFFLRESTQQYMSMVMSASIIFFSFLRILFCNNKTFVTFHLNRKVQIHVLLTFLIGIVWGLYAYFQLYSDNEALRNLVILINFGLIAASLATLSTWMPSYLAYMLPQSFAIFYVFINLKSEYNFHMAAAFIIFTGIMLATSFRFNRRFISETQLIENLNHEIGVREEVQLELENNKSNLECIVKKRTKDLIDINLHLENVILEKEEAEKSLQYLAYHDELTGLPNRNLLLDRINQSIKISSRDNQQMAILFLDLDRFKSINDSLGHNVGDDLLREIPVRLLNILRSHDTVSRNGGDEFVVVLEKLKDASEAVYVAKKIIECLSETFNIQSHTIHIGASIGISVYPDDGDSPVALLNNADTAMYRAKKSGGKQLQFYDESMSHQLRDRLELESELHKAIENNEFYMVYQPKVDCNTGETVGFESLIRWNNAKYGEIGPDRFIPVLEETGMIYDVGVWIVTEVLTFIEQHHTNNQSFSINLSALQCNNFDFIVVVNDLINNLTDRT